MVGFGHGTWWWSESELHKVKCHVNKLQDVKGGCLALAFLLYKGKVTMNKVAKLKMAPMKLKKALMKKPSIAMKMKLKKTVMKKPLTATKEFAMKKVTMNKASMKVCKKAGKALKTRKAATIKKPLTSRVSGSMPSNKGATMKKPAMSGNKV